MVHREFENGGPKVFEQALAGYERVSKRNGAVVFH